MACPTNSRQQPLFAVRRFLPQPYKKGSFFDVVERFGELIIKAEDFPRASHEAGGIEGICVVLKSKLVLIQRMHGWSDEETVLRATTDLGVKACLGLGVDQPGPSQPTLSRHRQRMQELGLDQVYMQRFIELVTMLELVQPQEAVLVDSVPVDGAGQVLDSYNLLAGAVRQGLRRLAQCTTETVAQVAIVARPAGVLAGGAAMLQARGAHTHRDGVKVEADVLDANPLQAEERVEYSREAHGNCSCLVVENST